MVSGTTIFTNVNISDIISNTQPPSGYLQPAGMVFVIRCIPDIFTREQFNIGVCAIGENGKRRVKVITEPGRFACFYGDSASNVVFLAQAAGEAALNAAPSPSPQIIFDTPTPYYNSTLEDVVDSTFADQVTAAIPYKAPKDREQITDDIARVKTIDAIKKARALDTDFIASVPLVVLNTDTGPRSVYIPLQANHAVGTIRSADYSPDALKMHLLESALDMEAAQRWREKMSAGLFILRPAHKDKKAAEAIDRTIDAVLWRCPKSLHVDIEPTVEDLGKKIETWADEYS